MTDFCHDCREPSDLGIKCRACYRLWQDDLSRSSTRDFEELQALSSAMKSDPASSYAVAKAILRKEDRALHGAAAEMMRRVKAGLAGAYGGSVEIALVGWLNHGNDEARKPRGRLED